MLDPPESCLLTTCCVVATSTKSIFMSAERDPQTVSFEKSRTYPLTLNERGLSALRNIEGLEPAVKAKGIEIEGTIAHQKNGKTRLLPRKKPLVALARSELAIALLELTEKYDHTQVNIHFNCKCTSVDFEHSTAPHCPSSYPEGIER